MNCHEIHLVVIFLLQQIKIPPFQGRKNKPFHSHRRFTTERHLIYPINPLATGRVSYRRREPAETVRPSDSDTANIVVTIAAPQLLAPLIFGIVTLS